MNNRFRDRIKALLKIFLCDHRWSEPKPTGLQHGCVAMVRCVECGLMRWLVTRD